MAHRVSPAAEADLDDTWHWVAVDSGSSEIADRLIDDITSRFLLLSDHPYLGRLRAENSGFGIRTLAAGRFVIAYRVDNDDTAVVVRVLHGSRNVNLIVE